MLAIRGGVLALGRMPRTFAVVGVTGGFGLLIGAGLFPLPCPMKVVTGLDCPFCGGSRAAAALLHGDPLAALDHNAFAVLFVLPLTLAFAAALARMELGFSRNYWPPGRRGVVLGYSLLATMLLWGVLRNLPFEPFIALRA